MPFDCDGSLERLVALFEKHTDEFLKFKNIPAAERRHPRPDVCAFLYLHEKLGGEHDVVTGAEHDEIYLGFEDLARLTDEDVLYIHRCGVRYDETYDCLAMFV